MKKSLSNHLLTVGSVAFDSIKTPFGQAKKTLGGSATYFSLAASFFAQPSIIAVVGQDFQHRHKQILQKRQIDLSGLRVQKGKSFAWTGEYFLDLNTRQTLKLALNVFADFKPQLLLHHRQSPYVFLGNIHPKLQLQVLRQIENSKLVGLDTVDFWIEHNLKELQKVLKLVDVFVINEAEARQLSKERNLRQAAKKIIRMMGKTKSPILIIKQGEYGLLMFYHGEIFNSPGYPLETIFDPTGAGDSFAGGFMGYLAGVDKVDENHLKRACIFGSVIASFCVEDFGTKRLERLTKKEIQNRFAEFKHLTHFEIK